MRQSPLVRPTKPGTLSDRLHGLLGLGLGSVRWLQCAASGLATDR